MNRFRLPSRVGVVAVLLGAAACTDSPLLPTQPGPAPRALLTCSADVANRTVECRRIDDRPAGPSYAEIHLGGQDLYVKLASSGTSYDAGTELFTSNVTVQNLLHQALGTSDGVTVNGVKVFFLSGPTVTSGTGDVTVNPDGTGTFTAANQPYYEYLEILDPMEISSSEPWSFSVSPTVGTFAFTVAVAAEVSDPGLRFDAVWDGSESSDWGTAGNWKGNSVPDSNAVSVFIPADSVASVDPVLDQNRTVQSLRVAGTGTLGLGGHTLTAAQNVDAVGAVQNGTLRMTGANTLLRGTVNALQVDGSTNLQGATTATGAVTVTGTLTITGHTLTISVP